MPTVKVSKYIIIIEDYNKGGLKAMYQYTTLEEAENYYVVYRNSFKGCKVQLVAVLKEEVIF